MFNFRFFWKRGAGKEIVLGRRGLGKSEFFYLFLEVFLRYFILDFRDGLG